MGCLLVACFEVVCGFGRLTKYGSFPFGNVVWPLYCLVFGVVWFGYVWVWLGVVVCVWLCFAYLMLLSSMGLFGLCLFCFV